MSTIGLRLKQERLRVGLSQRELAHVGGVGDNAQRMYEKGRRLPRADYLSKILTTGIDVLYVLTAKSTPLALGPKGDGIADALDAAFDTYAVEEDLLGKALAISPAMASELRLFCKNQMTVIATMKHLAILGQVQEYRDVHERVRGALIALKMNALIIAQTAAMPMDPDRLQHEGNYTQPDSRHLD